jgi:CBS domain-containing protein
MDGGRVLRSLLALRLDYVRATQIAAGLGQVMALVFAFIGFTQGHPMLFFIAFFVWIGASQESGMAQMKSSLSGTLAYQAMLREFRTLHPDDTLQHAVECILAGSQQDFPVVADGQTTGILTRSGLMAALAKQGASARVGEVMERSFPAVGAEELLEDAFARLQESRCDCLPVMDGGRMIGLLTAENISEYIMIREALRSSSGRAKPPALRRGRAG